MLGLLAARQLGLATAGAGAEAALARLDRVLPPRLRDRVRALGQTLDFTGRARDGVPAPASSAVRELGRSLVDAAGPTR